MRVKGPVKFMRKAPFLAQCGGWFRVQKKLIALRNIECEEYDDFSEAKRLFKEDERAHRLREQESGFDGNVQSKIRIFESGGVASQGGVRKTEPTITSR